MSLLVSNLVNDAAVKIGDPNQVRVRSSDWLLFYNQSVRELCEKADVMQYRADFNLGTQALYPYPDEMTTMARLEVTETPSDADSWRIVTEKFEDEFRAMTTTRYPVGSLPDHYFADKVGFYLIPRPAVAIVGGGRTTYFGLADRITDTATATYQLPEFTQDYVVRRMTIYGKMARHRITEANAELEQWFADVEGLMDKMEDRSKDRRSSLAPRRNRYAGMN